MKRMAASFTIAGRNNGFSKADARASTLASVAAYRQAMAEFADMRTMDIWYAHLTEDDVMAAVRGAVTEAEKGGGKKKAKARRKQQVKAAKRAEKTREKAHTRDSLQALSKLGEVVDGRYRIVSQPPIDHLGRLGQRLQAVAGVWRLLPGSSPPSWPPSPAACAGLLASSSRPPSLGLVSPHHGAAAMTSSSVRSACRMFHRPRSPGVSAIACR